MPVDAYQTAFSIWFDANRSRFYDGLGGDTNVGKSARAEWMQMSEEEKNTWREKTNIGAQCLRGKLRKVKRKGTTMITPSESIDPNDVFSSLPPLILVRHILPQVSPEYYAQLHLVSRRFHRLLSDYADDLPKQDFKYLTFNHDWDDEFDVVEFRRGYSGSFEGMCENLDGSRNDKGPSLAVLLRHQRLTYELHFGQGFELKNFVNTLIHLAKQKCLCMTDILFECPMWDVTRGQLKELFSHCSSRLKTLTVDRYADFERGLITDALIAPIIANGCLRALFFYCPGGLTDLTLDRFPLIIDGFHLVLHHERITPRGVYRFIQRFRNDQKNCSGQLMVCTSLEKPLRKLITPDDVRLTEFYGIETYEWIFYKIPGDASSPQLCIEFKLAA
uniref:F-box domain-containing protein n=1 Tax=Plectus sambesii TaxID=2011161 RepID=A0A914XNW2_9BILA